VTLLEILNRWRWTIAWWAVVAYTVLVVWAVR
jgi:hypothetical protein